jgi:hypothetical protein
MNFFQIERRELKPKSGSGCKPSKVVDSSVASAKTAGGDQNMSTTITCTIVFRLPRNYCVAPRQLRWSSVNPLHARLYRTKFRFKCAPTRIEERLRTVIFVFISGSTHLAFHMTCHRCMGGGWGHFQGISTIRNSMRDQRSRILTRRHSFSTSWSFFVCRPNNWNATKNGRCQYQRTHNFRDPRHVEKDTVRLLTFPVSSLDC